MAKMTPYVCLSRDVDEGRYLVTRVMNDELIVWRKNGSLLAALNVCPHRGFPIAAGIGELPLKCRYHGLRFNEVPQWNIYESCGFAFLGHPGDGAKDIDQMLIAGSFDLMGEEFGSVEEPVRAPYSLWMQNTMDPKHVQYVHPGFVSIFAAPVQPHSLSISDDNSVSSYRLNVVKDVAARYQRNLGSEIPSSFFHGSVSPHLSVTSFLNVFFSVETAQPIDGFARCVVRTRFFQRRGAAIPGTLLRLAMVRNRVLLKEDRDVVETWALGRPWAPSVWHSGEERIRAYRDSVGVV